MYMGAKRHVDQRVAILITPSALWGVELYDQCIRFTLELLGITYCRRSAGMPGGGAKIQQAQ